MTQSRMRPRIAYRIGERGDIETVKELFRTEGELSSVAIGVLAHDDLVFWLALDGDELVGVVLTRPLPSETRPRYGGVDELLVARTHRRLGVGRHLMELSEAHYREEGLDGLQLVVVEHNEPALNLYRAIGFDVVQTRLRMMKPF